MRFVLETMGVKEQMEDTENDLEKSNYGSEKIIKSPTFSSLFFLFNNNN